MNTNSTRYRKFRLFHVLPAVWLLAGGLPTRAAVEHLRPDEVVQMVSLWQQLRDLDGREWTAFKMESWTNLTGLLATYLSDAQNKTAAVDELVATHFRSCFPKGWRQSLDQLKEISLTTNGVTIVAQTNDLRVIQRLPDGKLMVGMPEELMEVMWLVDAIEPWIIEQSRRWSREAARLSASAARSYFSNAVVLAIHDYVRMEKRLGKVQMLLDQPDWITTTMGMQRDRLRQLVAATGAGGAYTNLISSLASAKVMSTAKARDMETAFARLRAGRLQLVQISRDLEIECVRIKDWFERHGSTLQSLGGYYQKLLATYTVDLPADATGRGSCFLRFRLEPPENARMDGPGTLVTASLSLCQPRKGEVIQAREHPNAPVQFGRSAPTEAPSAEEIPLGITMGQLRFSTSKGVEVSGGIFPTVKIDPPVLEAALRQLGLPAPIRVSQLELAIPDLDHIRVDADLQLPGAGMGLPAFPTVPRFRAAFLLDARGKNLAAIRDAVAAEVDRVQAQFETQWRAEIGRLPATATFRLGEFKSLGRWSQGVFAYHVDLRLTRIGSWTVDGETGSWGASVACIDKGGNWIFDLDAQGDPGPLVSFLRRKLAEEFLAPIRSAFASREGPAAFAQLGNYARIEGLRYIADRRSVTGTLRINTVALSSKLSIPAIDFEVSSDGKLTWKEDVVKALRDGLKQAAGELIQKLADRVQRDLGEAVIAKLKTSELRVLGGTFKVTRVVPEGLAAAVDLEGSIGGKSIVVRKLWVLGAKLDKDGTIQAPRFDFREIEISPRLEDLAAGFLKWSNPSLLRISQVTTSPDGVRFSLALRLEALGGDVPVMDVELGADGVATKFSADAVNKAIAERLENFLAIHKLALPDLGSVKNVHLDTRRLKVVGGLEVWLSGDALVPGGEALNLVLPFSVRVVPGLEVIVNTEAAKQQALAALGSMLGSILPNGSPIKSLSVLPGRPYGIRFDIQLHPWVFEVEVKDIQLTTAGLRMPAAISIQVPGFIPVPTAFAMVNPGVVIPLNKHGEIGIVGDLTLASQGIEKIIKFRSRLAAKLGEIGEFTMEGSLVLMDCLPLVQVSGLADFRRGDLQLDSRTVGLVDRILQFRDRLHVNAPKGLFEQNASLGVLGLRLTQTQVRIQVFGEASLAASQEVDLPIARAEVRVNASLDLRKIGAEAGFDVGLGGFTLSGAHLKADVQKVDLDFDVMLFHVRVLAPSITTITPDRVLHAILNLINFDPSSIFESLIKRNVTVSFFDNSGKPSKGSIGEGVSPPEDPRGEPPDSMEKKNDSPPEQTQDGQPATPTGPYDQTVPLTGNDQPPSGTKEKQSSDSRSSTPPEHRPPKSYIVYKPGNVAFDIIPDPKFRGLFVERFHRKGGYWLAWCSISKAVRDHLVSSKTMVIETFWLHDPKHFGGIRDRQGRPMSGGVFYVTLNDANQIHVAGRFPNGVVTPVEVPLDQLGIKPEKTRNWWQRLFSSQKESRFTSGDLQVIGEYAKAKVTPGFKSVQFNGRIDPVARKAGDRDVVPPPLFKMQFVDERDNVRMLLLPTEGSSIEVRSSDALYTHLQPGGDAQRTVRADAVIALLADAGATGDWTRLLHAPGSGPLLFARRSHANGLPAEVWCVKSDGSFASPARWRGPSAPASSHFNPVWADADALAVFLGSQLAAGQWRDIQVNPHATGETRGGLGRGLVNEQNHAAPPSADWALRIVQKRSGGSLRDVGEFNGAKLAAAYDGWVRTRALRDAKFATLAEPGARTWLLEELLAPPGHWPERWNADPLLLLERVR